MPADASPRRTALRAPGAGRGDAGEAMPGAAPPARDPGALLRRWRRHRGWSQLKLATEADVSTRHISFVETGRARPSRAMIVTLAETLEVPLRERNRILEAAGFAALYRERPLDDDALAPVARVLDLILDNQLPAGAAAVDGCWNVLQANRALAAIAGRFLDPAQLAKAPLNLMRATFGEGGLHRFLVNWDEAGPALLHRMRREVEESAHPGAEALLEEALSSPAIARAWTAAPGPDPAAVLIPLHLVRGDLELRLFGTITTLGTPRDVTLQEMRIECFYPMDAATQAVLERLSAAP